MMYFNVFKVLKKAGLPSRSIPPKFTFTPHVIKLFKVDTRLAILILNSILSLRRIDYASLSSLGLDG